MSSGTNQERLQQNNTKLEEHKAALEQLTEMTSKIVSTNDATATPEDMIYPKTAYIKGQKVTGTLTITEKPITNEVLFHTNTDYAGNDQLYAINDEHIMIERLYNKVCISQINDNNTITTLYENDTFFTETTGMTLDISNKVYDPNDENNYSCLVAYSTVNFVGNESSSTILPVYIAEFKCENGIYSLTDLTSISHFTNPTAKFLETDEGIYIITAGSNSTISSYQAIRICKLGYSYGSTVAITDTLSTYKYDNMGYSAMYQLVYNLTFTKHSNGNYAIGIVIGCNSTVGATYRRTASYVITVNASLSSVVSNKNVISIKNETSHLAHRNKAIVIGDYYMTAVASGSIVTLKLVKMNTSTSVTALNEIKIDTSTYLDSITVINIATINGFIIVCPSYTSGNMTSYILAIENDELVLKNSLNAIVSPHRVDAIYNGYRALQSNESDLAMICHSTGMYIIKREDDSMIRTSISDANYTYYNTTDATATSSDIVEGKTAYANGEKITGTVQERTTDVISTLETNSIEDLSQHGYVRVNTSSYDIPVLFRPNAPIEVVVDSTDLATAISLTPEKILKGNTILNVKGTLDISAPTNMNIFVQEEEPETKYGLWVKSAPRELIPSFVEASGPEFSVSISSTGKASPYTGLWSVYYKGWVYYLQSTEGNRDNATSLLHRYNPADGTTEQVADLGFVPYRRCLEGPILYYSNSTSIGKIDLSSDTFTPTLLYSGKQFWGYKSDDDGIAMAVHNGFAYFFGGQNVGVARSNGKKLNLSTGAISSITSMATAYGPTIVIGDYIYVFRGYGTDGSSYKYDTVNGTRFSLASCPIMCSNYAYTPDNNLIYLTNWEGTGTKVYCYNIQKNTFTLVGNLPSAFEGNYENSYFDGIDIHYLHANEEIISIYPSMEVIPNHLVVYEYDRKYKTKLINNGPNTYVDDAIVVNDIGLIETDTYVYIGDGEDWI